MDGTEFGRTGPGKRAADDGKSFQGGRGQLVAPEQSPILAEELEEEGVPYELLEIPYARHAFDLNWGGWANQITNPAVEEFLDRHFPVDEESP